MGKKIQWYLSSVRCPYYKATQQQKIICEGNSEMSSIYGTFANKAQYKAYAKKHCCNDYETCEIYQIKRDTFSKKPN